MYVYYYFPDYRLNAENDKLVTRLADAPMHIICHCMHTNRAGSKEVWPKMHILSKYPLASSRRERFPIEGVERI